ncbi:hypothetical protein ACEZDB_13700 [Streptacidiphilus sp. N1-3]|uniref:Uncharacterized protein n=1 Tax=Streptacidiphilus alkalitolerans TaxID=3342712 RepID=A0ABV6X077_9ACTN
MRLGCRQYREGGTEQEGDFAQGGGRHGVGEQGPEEDARLSQTVHQAGGLRAHQGLRHRERAGD